MISPAPAVTYFLAERIEAGDFPSAVYLVAEHGAEVFADAVGHSVVEPYRIATTRNTIYDLASLTKPLITGLLCARRVETGELSLEYPLSHYLAEFDRSDKKSITLRHLLTHTSGLPAWRPLYILSDDDPASVAAVISEQQLEAPPGSRVIYSDLGFIALGLMLTRITGKELTELARQEIFSPLKLQQTFFNPEIAMQTGIAACETGNLYEQQTSRDAGLGEYKKSRQSLIWGEVHDGNAYFLGGAAGHAGLFSTAAETLVLAEQYLGGLSQLLKPETCDLARENMTAGLNEARSFAWQLAATELSTAGASLPPDSFGHNGFTGTSCWIDPSHERVFVLLTNRTHNHPLPFININGVRRRFHSLAVQALKK